MFTIAIKSKSMSLIVSSKYSKWTVSHSETALMEGNCERFNGNVRNSVSVIYIDSQHKIVGKSVV